MKKQIWDAERSEQDIWSGLYQLSDDKTIKQLGIACQRFLDADCLMMTSMPAWFFNRVVGLGLDQPVMEEDIDILVDLYHTRRLPIGISLCPYTQTKQIDQWLIAKGFSIANYWVKMIRNASPPTPSGSTLHVEPAGSDQAEIVADIVITGFELSDDLKPVFGSAVQSENNHVYIAWDGDTPAAVGMLTVVGDIGHLNTATTLPEFRGRGAQGTIMARRIQDGIELGCKQFVTETWDPGGEINHSYNNMLRYGFELAYKRPNWVLECPTK